MHGTFGRHVLAELSLIDFDILNDHRFILNTLIDASTEAGATVLGHNYHLFEPYGCSIILLLAESHVTIHTFPEYGYASFDAYTCGPIANPMVILENTAKRFNAKAVEFQEIQRGIESCIYNVYTTSKDFY